MPAGFTRRSYKSDSVDMFCRVCEDYVTVDMSRWCKETVPASDSFVVSSNGEVSVRTKAGVMGVPAGWISTSQRRAFMCADCGRSEQGRQYLYDRSLDLVTM